MVRFRVSVSVRNMIRVLVSIRVSVRVSLFWGLGLCLELVLVL